MKLQYAFLLVFWTISSISCFTLKKKRQVRDQAARTYFQQFGKDFEFHGFSAGVFNDSMLRKHTRKSLRHALNTLERAMALSPDSSTNDGGIVLGTRDSFYFNIFKISYITKNRLKTDRIHFRE